MNFSLYGIGSNNEDLCLANSVTTHMILKDKKYFSHLIKGNANVHTISGSTELIEGSGRATILLLEGTKLFINDALFSMKSQRNLLSFKDIRQNGYHIEIVNEKNIKYLYIIKIVSGKKCILEKSLAFSLGLYYTHISTIETHAILSQKFIDTNTFIIWHDRLGHLGSIIMHKITENSHGHPLKKILQFNEFSCATCSQRKLIIRPSPIKIGHESLAFSRMSSG